ncbi:MAG: hypothetical protein IJ323_04240 [Clostridia bacterium]|nr:hypothetical protein [Clostridia bacterium]
MKKILNVLYTAVCHFALSFSGIILFFWLFMEEAQYIDYEKILIFFRFALIFGAASVVFAIPKIPYVVKVALHFVINTIAFVATFATATGISQMRAFVVGALFVIIYAVIFAIVKVLQALSKRFTKNV